MKACRILTAPITCITYRSPALAHTSLLQFFNKFGIKYGQLKVTPNMHLHSHLINCVVDYGPVHNFWLLSFERFNGVLGHFKTNRRAVEIQLMRKFWDQDIRDLPFPSLFKKQLEPVFSRMKTSVVDPVYDVSSAAEHLSLSQGPVTKGNLWLNTALFS